MGIKNIIILRSVSGAGKSTLAYLLCANRFGWVSVEADAFFLNKETNEYNFDPAKLGAAHLECQQKFMEYLTEPSIEGIVVANTNTKASDWKFYEDAAKKGGHRVTFVVIENRHGNKDVHNVPDFALDRQDTAIRDSLKLR